MFRKILKTMKNNILGFIVGAIIFSGVGYALAATIQSSNVSYTTSNNSSISNVKQAIDDLYGNANIIVYRYWNNNFMNTTYSSSSMPLDTGIKGVYYTRASLASAYSDFSTYPIYIRTAILQGNILGHEVCVFVNNKEFCLALSYWDTYAYGTQKKLEQDMINHGISPTTCVSSNNYYGRCIYGDVSVYANSDSSARVEAGYHYCQITGDGSALCK